MSTFHNYLQCLGWINAKDSLVCRQGENQEYLSVYDTRILTISIESPLPERLKEARLEAGLSQKKLGIEAGIDEFSASPRINQYEKGTHAPNYDMIMRIGDVLDLPVAYFYAENSELAEMIKNYHRKGS